jgi:hypothetical protein
MPRVTPSRDRPASLVTARAEGTEKVPAVSGDIQEDGNLPVLLHPRRGDELDAVFAHALICGLEIIDAKEHADATGELLADGLRLPLAVRPRRTAVRAFGGLTTTHRLGRPSFVDAGESSTSSKPSFSTKNSIATS